MRRAQEEGDVCLISKQNDSEYIRQLISAIRAHRNLRLNGNQLTSMPEGVLDGLTSLWYVSSPFVRCVAERECAHRLNT